jgi:glyoxylase-like metal-dependent hydrolase (beta-lactamase superfamily II)/8-oxo-dGTP pyrophosphatase MutT (NUDIX family)
MEKSKILDAVSAVFVYDGSLFVVQRQSYLAAFPGYCAFPGGKVERSETEEPYQTKYLRDHNARFMRALCRELLEELNFDLNAAITNGQALSVSELGTVTTPEMAPIRFKTRFYKIVCKTPIDFQVNPGEAEFSKWESCDTLLAQYNQGKILAVPPTIWIFEAFSNNWNTEQIDRFSPERHLKENAFCFEFLRGVRQIPVYSRALPPANITNAFVIGDEGSPQFLIDPSPKSMEEFQKLRDGVSRFQISGVFLTHHHPDHHEFANEMARALNVPILLSQDSHDRIRSIWGDDYFKDIEPHFAKEGDILTQWLGNDVKIYAIPGHDEGQLALAPRSMEWFLVGDLIQGVGTVVVSSPEGDMKKYFASLARVIRLDPRVIIPSHGIPMGSVYRLRATLAHRQMREQQILELSESGKSKQEMLLEIYKDVDPRLHPLAMCNIESHLEKLRKERRL